MLEVVQDEKLRFTFGDKEGGSEEKIEVTVTLRPYEDTTLLELVQENMADTPEPKSTGIWVGI